MAHFQTLFSTFRVHPLFLYKLWAVPIAKLVSSSNTSSVSTLSKSALYTVIYRQKNLSAVAARCLHPRSSFICTKYLSVNVLCCQYGIKLHNSSIKQLLVVYNRLVCKYNHWLSTLTQPHLSSRIKPDYRRFYPHPACQNFSARILTAYAETILYYV